MPNWCDNELTITGPAARLKECLGAIGDGDNAIDFQRIKPMPSMLEGTTAPTEWWVLFLLDIKDSTDPWMQTRILRVLKDAGYDDDTKASAFLDQPDANSKTKELLKQTHPDWEARCNDVRPQLEQTGYPNWYDWASDNWGTKWNADGAEVTLYEFRETVEAAIKFATAWSPPLPIIKTLGERYPDLTFTLVYYESGMGFHGRYRVESGQVEEDVCGEYYGDRGG